jgi:hypothetical protein
VGSDNALHNAIKTTRHFSRTSSLDFSVINHSVLSPEDDRIIDHRKMKA